MTDELRDYWTEGPGSESLRSPGWYSRALRWARRPRRGDGPAYDVNAEIAAERRRLGLA